MDNWTDAESWNRCAKAESAIVVEWSNRPNESHHVNRIEEISLRYKKRSNPLESSTYKFLLQDVTRKQGKKKMRKPSDFRVQSADYLTECRRQKLETLGLESRPTTSQSRRNLERYTYILLLIFLIARHDDDKNKFCLIRSFAYLICIDRMYPFEGTNRERWSQAFFIPCFWSFHKEMKSKSIGKEIYSKFIL